MVSIITHRFERLRGIIQLRKDRIKELEEQAVELFEQGNVDEIEALMQHKDLILETNRQLALFIERWERTTASKQEKLTI